MSKSVKSKKAENDTKSEVGKIPESGTKRVTDTGEPKNSIDAKAVKKLADKKVKNALMNAEKILNKARESERNVDAGKRKAKSKEMKKLCEETNSVFWHQKTKSEKATERIIEEGLKSGVRLSAVQVRMIKNEMRIQEKIVYPVQAIAYVNSLENRVGRRDMAIILMAGGIVLTLAKCGMPKNARAYQIKAKALAKAQTDDTFGFFTPAFPTLAIFIGLIGGLLSAIENFDDKDGTGNSATVNGAIDDCQVQVDALLTYVNGKCRANQLDALEIIAAAGMDPVKKREKDQKPDFQIKQGATGEIMLISLAGKIDKKRVPTTYYWQYGLKDAMGNWIWKDLPDTVGVCKTTATGMPTDQIVAFRKSTKTTKGGRSAWCTPITIAPK